MTMMTFTPNRVSILAVLFICIVGSLKLQAQINHGGTPLRWDEKSQTRLDWQDFEALDLKKLKRKTAQRPNSKTLLGVLELNTT